MFCFFHNQFIEEEKVTISMHDRGFTIGDGIFDTQMCIDGFIPDADLHFNRMKHDAEVMGLPFGTGQDDLHKIAAMLLARNAIKTGRWIIRTQLTRGAALRGLQPPEHPDPTLVMRALPAPPPNQTPVKAVIALSVRRNEFSPLSRIKSTNYADNMIALIEAQKLGADDAVLCNTKGQIVCATTSNIFIVEKGNWITPPLTDGVLAGITRMKLIAEKNAREESITIPRIQSADEIWQCNSVMGIRRMFLPDMIV